MFLLFALAVLGLTLFRKGVVPVPDVYGLSAHGTGYTNLPQVYRDEIVEKNFAGQDQTSVRAPFGVNPQQKYIEDDQIFRDSKFAFSYNQHLWDATVANHDWRLDDNFTGPRNDMLRLHSTESAIPFMHQFLNAPAHNNRTNLWYGTTVW